MSSLVHAAQTTDLVSRLQRVLSAANLDCGGQKTLNGALDRFMSLEYRRQIRKALADARQQRDQIIARLAFLAEIDEITEHESDRTAFFEVAVLFDEIGAAAAEAAKAIRLVATMERRDNRASPQLR